MTTAEFEGTCADCGGRIKVGDRIILAGGAGWVHDPCLELKRGEMCSECFTEKSLSGACGC